MKNKNSAVAFMPFKQREKSTRNYLFFIVCVTDTRRILQLVTSLNNKTTMGQSTVVHALSI